tara:strand:- start:296 stop:475 length:180 start_codon:yes stop_codon:yes gene_type:complete
VRILAAGIGRSKPSFIFEPGIEVILVLGGLGVSVLVHSRPFELESFDLRERKGHVYAAL